jgi:hypothetical protein
LRMFVFMGRQPAKFTRGRYRLHAGRIDHPNLIAANKGTPLSNWERDGRSGIRPW